MCRGFSVQKSPDLGSKRMRRPVLVLRCMQGALVQGALVQNVSVYELSYPYYYLLIPSEN